MAKSVYSREFKSIDTPEKAYILGLIYSDGYVGCYSGSYVTTIVMHKDDIELLKKIQSLFPFYHLRKHSETSYCLICNKKDCYNDLVSNGVLEKKSTDNKEYLKFPDITEELQSHFIRGYFDGDGSVFKQKLGNTKIEIGGTGFRMITDIVRILYNNRITVNLRCKYAGKALRKNDFYTLYTSSDKVSKDFARYIYKDSNGLFLQRKYDRLFYIPEYHKKERLICPCCGNNSTTYLGIRKMLHHTMQRGYCKNCNKQFSIKLTAPLNSNIQSGGDELLEG